MGALPCRIGTVPAGGTIAALSLNAGFPYGIDIARENDGMNRSCISRVCNLTTGGLQRHRVVWIREMTEPDIRQVRKTGPTIASTGVAEFERTANCRSGSSNTHRPFLARL
jgi:hypothetical protein